MNDSLISLYYVSPKEFYSNSIEMVCFYLNNYYQRDVTPADILFNSHGKPYLPKDDIWFNVSHSNGVKVLAISLIGEIGVDVEYCKVRDLSFAKKVLTQKEYDDFIIMDSETQLKYFYEKWVLKEAYVKTVGKGLTIQFDKIHVSQTKENLFEIIEHKNNDSFYGKLFFNNQFNVAVVSRYDCHINAAKIMNFKSTKDMKKCM